LNAAVGAALLAAQGPASDATAMGPVADAPTGVAPTAWATGVAGAAAAESALEGAPDATFRALAWSEDDRGSDEVVPYAGADYEAGPIDPRPQLDFDRDAETELVEQPLLPWYRRPPVIFGAAAAALLLAVGGLAVTLTGQSSPTDPGQTTAPSEPGSAPSEAPVVTPETVTVTGGDGQETVVTQTPPPPVTTTTSSPTTTTSPTTTSTTTTTTTTRTTTTTTTPPVITTTPPVITTTPPVPEPEPDPGAADGVASPQAPRLISLVTAPSH
jgi:hypothetical protein